MLLRLICIISFLVFFSLLQPSFSQKHDYHWLLGNSYDQEWVDGSRMDFNTVPVSIEEHIRHMSFHGAIAVMSDAEGRLLFYTNGCYIADSTDNVMENGDGLNPGQVHNIQCYPGGAEAYTSGTQSILCLPKPGSEDIYYLFHKGIEYDYSLEIWVFTNVLYATIIDCMLLLFHPLLSIKSYCRNIN